MEKRWVSELKVAVEFGGKEESVKKRITRSRLKSGNIKACR